MFGISYFKGQPSHYIQKYTGGVKRQSGQGLSFFYFPFQTQIVAVPTQSIDQPFVFNDISRDYQTVSVQGQVTYRISDPEKAAALLNLAIDPKTGQHVTEDLRVLGQRIVNMLQIATHEEVESRTLEACIRESQAIGTAVSDRAIANESRRSVGGEILGLLSLSVRPSAVRYQAL
ncbi:MAG: SPFH domain-containing protein, partial [Pirellulaceae bacterium]